MTTDVLADIQRFQVGMDRQKRSLLPGSYGIAECLVLGDPYVVWFASRSSVGVFDFCRVSEPALHTEARHD